MTRSIRSYLFQSYLVVVLLGMGLVSVLVWRSVEKMYLDTQRENLLAQARISADALLGQDFPITDSQPYSQVTNVMPGIHSRFLADAGGVVVNYPFVGSELAVPAAEQTMVVSAQELSQRPEIIQALRGEAATAIREVDSAGGRRVLYAAAPVTGMDGDVTGLVYLAMPLPTAGLPTSLAWQLGGAVVAAALLALVAGSLISRRLARPIEMVSTATQSLGTGEFTQLVPEQTEIRELDNLGTAFNHMAASLLQSEQSKNAFIADVTHELRTPLTVIKGTIETLEDGALDDPEGRGPLLTAMQQETDRLIRLVNDLLILTRADAGTLNLNMHLFDLAELARSRCKLLQVLADQRRIHLGVTTIGGDFQVRGDSDRLAQVLDNLLENAIRFSPDEGTVSVSLQYSGEEICCAVTDQGIGIAQQHLTRIFERFYRAEPSRDRKTGGAGLGLAIAQALINAHGGRIWAESEPGQGTTITFTIPLEPVATKITVS